MSDDERPTEPEDRGAAKSGSGGADTETSTRTGPAQFLREVRGELRKVAWPNRKELANYTLVVLVVTVVLTLVVWGFDFIIREAVINTLG
jgi:preprotein translocase subunit SecE